MVRGDGNPYLRRFKDEARRFPILKLFQIPSSKDRGQHQQTAETRGRAAVIEFWRGSQREEVVKEVKDFDSPAKLVDYLSHPRRCSRRLFLLEGLSPWYVEAFGHFLNVDPRVFASQYRCVHWDNLWHGAQRTLRSCRSLANSSRYYTLKYYEIWNLENRPLKYGNRKGRDGQVWANYTTTGIPSREIHRSPTSVKNEKSAREDDQRFRAYLLRGNASFWYQTYVDHTEHEEPESWDALMLLDPPLGGYLRFKENEESIPIAKATRYQGGYPDLMQWRPLQIDNDYQKQAQISMFDHILYYWENDAASARYLKNVEATATHMKQLVATHWNCLLNQSWAALSYLEHDIGDLENRLAVHDQSKNERKEWYKLEKNLRSMNTLRRRMNWYLEQSKENLYQLDIDGDDREPRDGNTDLKRDFLDIVARLEFYKSCSENLVDIAATIASLRQAKEGLVTSYFVNLLTMLGVVIFPLTFLCSIFSMGGHFQAGKPHFWVYWAIAIPLAAALLLLVWFGKRWYIQQQQQSKIREVETRDEADTDRLPIVLDFARRSERRAGTSKSQRRRHSELV